MHEPKRCPRCGLVTTDYHNGKRPCYCRPCDNAFHKERREQGYVKPKVRKPYVLPEHMRPTIIPTAMDLAWFAGLFEGEGSVSGQGYPEMSQKDDWPLRFIRDRFGGTIALYTSKSSGRSYFRWWLTGPHGRELLAQISPLLSPRRREQIRSKLP